jgi:Fanconi anemia group M protein
MAGSAPTVLIHADQRERRSGVLEALDALEGVECQVCQLDVGDYLLGLQTVVERKSTSDFVASIIDRRLFNQIERMKATFGEPLLIIEGPDPLDDPGLHPNALRGALSYVQVLQRIPIIRTRDAEDTAAFLHTMGRHVQHGLGYEISLHRKPKASDPAAQQEYVAAAIPGIGPKLARALLARFGTLEALFCATKDDLVSVSGVGEVTAERFRALLTRRYSGD